VIEYALAILTLSRTQFERLERLQNEAMRIVLGCTRDTACRAMRYLLDIPTMEGRTRICRARAYLRISADKLHPLYSEIRKQKGARLKRGKSWMGLTEDIIQQVCSIDEIDTGAEWLVLTAECDASISVCIKLSRECRQQNPVAVEAEVQALIFENSPEAEAVIYTDGSVVRHTRSSWAFTAQVKGKTKMEDSGAFSVTTSSLTMEVMAVTKAMAWLETQTFTDVCFLSDSMSMLRKIENGWFRRQWLESLARSKLTKICFIFVPGHAGVRGNERADFLAGGAAMESGRSMDRSDILHAIREDSRENDSSKDIESVSMTRLYEHQVGRGVAREERFSGSQRRIVNQHRTGVVSRFTLRDILKRRSEHLWTEQFDVQ
jgi:ribonuclease HI